MRLQLLTWPEVEAYLAQSDAIVLPLGSTEQHGPNGLIGTDALCAESIACCGAGNDTDILVGPTQSLTPAQFNLAFPGTISLRASTFAQVLTDIVESLARSGFRKFYFLNGHGANVGVTRGAIHDLHQSRSLGSSADSPSLSFRFRSWWDFDETNAIRKELYADAEGMHATPSEVAITQAVVDRDPIVVDQMKLSPLSTDFLRSHAGDNHADAHVHRESFADGRVGSDPSLADAVAGQRLLDTAAREFAHDFRVFASEQQ